MREFPSHPGSLQTEYIQYHHPTPLTGFHPTLVRFKLLEIRVILPSEKGFHPTLVRFKQQLFLLFFSVLFLVSIPPWFASNHPEWGYSYKFLPSFHPTLVRFKQTMIQENSRLDKKVSIPPWFASNLYLSLTYDRLLMKFPSHPGSLQTEEIIDLVSREIKSFHPTLVRFKQTICRKNFQKKWFPSHPGSLQTLFT